MNQKEPTHHHSLSVTGIADALRQRQPGIMGEKRLGRFSVLVPLVEREDGTLAVLFEKRARTMRRQAGEICFPGGRAEEGDASPWETARRETSEELGLSAERIRRVGTLDTMVTPFACIYPFVGQIDSLAGMSPNPAEVEEVFCVPLQTLVATRPEVYPVKMKVEPGEDYPYHLIPGGKRYPWRTGTVHHLFYRVEGRVIWGLTARILEHFLELVGPEGEGQSGTR
ncbi:NUDIX hydrolase [Brevibacillus thermoruber]|uniref:NUDIX hydrolase n=1 Tax=Brevibacillus thermoruber TaxID=33942 RepID=UPI000A75E265|nr:CoA pyrophosphatase [Brevibacillus thermoruber]